MERFLPLPKLVRPEQHLDKMSFNVGRTSPLEAEDAAGRGATSCPLPDASVFEDASVGWMRWLPTSGDLHLSAVSQSLFGLMGQPSPGTLHDLTALIVEKDREAHCRALDKARNSGEPYRSEYRIVRPSQGDVIWIEERGGRVASACAGDEPVIQALQWRGFACERLTVDYARAVEQMHDADRRKDDFLAMLAHELRNPLAPIRNAAKALRRLGSAEPRIIEVAGVIGRQAEHMAALISDLLDVGRITRGTIDVDCEPTDVKRVIRDAVEQTTLLIEARGHALDVALAPESLCVLGDHVRLVQVVANLLVNAAKYTPDGGRIQLTGIRDGRDIVLRVSDTGIGIEPALLPHIFEAFTQSTQTIDRQQGGMGLGLAIVRGLVDMMGGFIEAHSDGLGRGSRFTVWLPALEQPALPPAPAPALEPVRRAG